MLIQLGIEFYRIDVEAEMEFNWTIRAYGGFDSGRVVKLLLEARYVVVAVRKHL